MKTTFQSNALKVTLTVWLISSLSSMGLTTLHLGPSSGEQDAVIDVPLEIRSNDNVTAIQFDVVYDPATVSVRNVAKGNATSRHTVDFEMISNGVTRVVVVSNTNSVLTEGILSTIGLEMLATVAEGNRSISFTNVLFSDTGGTEVAIAFAPYVSITSPSAGERFAESTLVGLSAVAVSYDGSITSVQFFADGTSVSLDTTAPYTASWTATGSGEIVLTAIAIAANSEQSTSLQVPLEIGPPPYDGWFDSNFSGAEQANPAISGLTADPDVDGIPNLLEYALGLDPRNIDSRGLPEIGIEYVGAFGYSSLTYRADPDVDDVTFTVEVSADGTTWQSGEGITEEISSEILGNKRVVKVRDLVPLEEEVPNTRLMRLNVQLNE